jgi:hypothetical protein
MSKTITALLSLALAMPATVMGQTAQGSSHQVATTWIQRANPSAIEGRPLFGRESVLPASARATQASTDAPQQSDRSWARRHPVALGTMIGAAAGSIWGAAVCWKQVCGDSQGPLLVALGLGLGAGIGAGVGITISFATR